MLAHGMESFKVETSIEENSQDLPPVLEPQTTLPNDSQYFTYTPPFEEYPYVEQDQFVQNPPQPKVFVFNFIDQYNVICGVCHSVVQFDTLFTEHMPFYHPEYSDYTIATSPPETHYYNDDSYIDMSCNGESYCDTSARMTTYKRPSRRVSSIRVSTTNMTLEQLEDALRQKMIEKMGRKVPVSLEDKQHARCGVCNAVVSLNRKFEVVHLIRHFNAWHPSTHKCTGLWLQKAQEAEFNDDDVKKPLSASDFAVINTVPGVSENLQCIWCGMFMDVNSIAMHFHELHPEEVEVPDCRLCLCELVINERFTEVYREDMEITLPDEHHFKSLRFNIVTRTEKAMDTGDENSGYGDQTYCTQQMNEKSKENDDHDSDNKSIEPYANSRMVFGKRKKPKRQFIIPALRQAAPTGSNFITPIRDGHWKCNVCNGDILAAVISAGAIKHYRYYHPNHLHALQFELCKARLERVSNGCMQLISPIEVTCTLCAQAYSLHKTYNMCRAIRHLKLKHPEYMPENNVIKSTTNWDKTCTLGLKEFLV